MKTDKNYFRTGDEGKQHKVVDLLQSLKSRANNDATQQNEYSKHFFKIKFNKTIKQRRPTKIRITLENLDWVRMGA